jgi:anti-anti-sigma factor
MKCAHLAWVRRAPLQNPTRLIVDLRNADYIDSFGVGVLVSIYHKARVKRIDLSVSGVRPPVDVVLRMANIHRLIPILNPLP